MQIRTMFLGVIALSSLLACKVNAAVIDFNAGCAATPVYVEDGFQISTNNGTNVSCSAGRFAAGSAFFITLETTDGTSFDLMSFEAGSTRTGVPFEQPLPVMGIFADGSGSISTTVTVPGIFDPANPTRALGLFVLAGFVDLSEVIFDTSNLHLLDNINAAPVAPRAVPLPAPFTLLLSALAVIFVIRLFAGGHALQCAWDERSDLLI